MYLYEDNDKKEKDTTPIKLEYAIGYLDNENNGLDNFIIALFYCQRSNNEVMSQSNFCRFLIDYEKAMIEYRDKERIDFQKFRSLVAESLQKYCFEDNVSKLIKMALYASACNSLEDLLTFCRISKNESEYDTLF